ncbi:hypothetical protein SAMN04487844_14740 [Methylobacterium sp. yr596]|nr:hypothetical protein SAMN04487844_14740 [Methylobacterium sp. yr596]
MSFRAPFLLSGWLLAAAVALASWAISPAPTVRLSNTLNGPIHILTER